MFARWMEKLREARDALSLVGGRQGRGLALALAGVAALSLSACGGGSQVKKFVPSKIVSFGDESSALVSVVRDPAATPLVYHYGQKYTVNYASAVDGDDNFYDCYYYNKLWIQVLAGGYGLGYRNSDAANLTPGCALDPFSGAVTYAEPHALVSGAPASKSVRDQVAAHRAELNGSTLVTMLAGQNDIVAAYKAALAGTAADKDAAAYAMELKGRELGGIINDITNTGARVVYLTVPDLSKSPLALAGDAAFMDQLVKRFNKGLVGLYGVKNDGRKVAIVQVAQETSKMATYPGTYGFADVATPWCNAAKVKKPDGTAVSANDPDFALYCNVLTGPDSGASDTGYLWADDTHLGPTVHAALGSLAYSRATANPF